MEMPKPDEHHKKLEAMVGEWTGEETMHPSPWDPQGGPATSRINARMDLDGFFLISDYVQERNGATTFRGHGVYGWDANQQKYTMHWFDSMGFDPGPPVPGTWEGNRLRFQHQAHMGHTRYTYEFIDKDTYSFNLEHSQDGKKWAPFVESTVRRNPA